MNDINDNAIKPISLEQQVGATPHMGRSVIPFVVRRGKKVPKELYEALRAIIELHTAEISGFSTGLRVTESSTGLQSVEYDGAELTSQLTDRYGKPMTHTLTEYVQKSHAAKWAGMSEYFIGVLFVEPSPDYTGIVDAWYYENFRVKRIDGIPAKRDLLATPSALKDLQDHVKATAGEQAQFRVVFTGDIHRGRDILDFGTKVMKLQALAEKGEMEPAAWNEKRELLFAETLAELFPEQPSGADA